MPDPPPRPPTRRPAPGAARRGLRALAVLAAVGVLAIVGSPLVLRGRLLASMIMQRLPATCGHVDIAAASLSRFAVVDLLLQRPFDLELDGITITDPAGRQVLDAHVVAARVRVQRSPLRIGILDARVGPGTWKMLTDRRFGVSLAAAFAPAASCGGGKALMPPPRVKGGAATFALSVEHVELIDLDAVFDFTDWALTLTHAFARGGLDVTAAPGQPTRLAFDVQDIRAGAGSLLRVGAPGRVAWAAQVPFDEVVIPRVATDRERPADLTLEVARAATGRSVLSGTSTFRGVFGSAGPDGRGMDLQASWTSFADAAAVLRARWRPIVARVMGTEELDLTAKVRGPFSGVAADLEARAAKLRLALGVEPDRRVRATLTLRGFDVTSRLPSSMRPLLGGSATGHVRLEARLDSELERVTGSLAEMDLHLDRAHPGPFPVRWRLHKSAEAPPAQTEPEPADLDMTVSAATLERGVIAVKGFGAAVAGGTLAGGVSLALIAPGSSRRLADPIVDGRMAFDGLDLGVLGGVPLGTIVSGKVAVGGSTDDLALTVRPGGARLVVLGGVPITLPPKMTARLYHGDHLTVPALTLTGPDGGTLEARGSLVFDQRIDAAVAVRRWPLAATGLPALLPGGGAWRGVLDGRVSATGQPAAPAVAGLLDLHGGVVAGFPLGDGRFTVANNHGSELRLSAQLGPHITADGRLRLAHGADLRASALLTALPLDPLLARLSPRASGTVTGEVDLALTGGGSLAAEARLTEVRLGWGRTVVANRDVLRVSGGLGHATLEPCRFEGSGLGVTVEGRLQGQTLDASAHGTAALATLVSLLPPTPVPVARPAGELAFTARASGRLAEPVLDIAASVGEPLTLTVLPARNVELPVTVSSGELTWQSAPGAEPRVRVARLTLSTPGAHAEVAGEAAVDMREPEASEGSWRASVEVEAAALARLVPRQLSHAEGRLTVTARLDGAPRSGRWGATVDTSPVVLVPRGTEAALTFSPMHAGFDGDSLLRIAPLEMSLGPSGRIALGAPEQPALMEIRTFDPLEVGRLDVGLRGTGITLPQPVAGVRVAGAEFDLHLRGPDPLGRFVLSGVVSVPRARYVGKTESASPLSTSGSSALARFTKRVWLDLRVRLPAFDVSAPGPDLALEVDCRVQGPLSAPSTSGSLRGLTVYSRAALFMADLVRGSHLRDCRK